MSILAILLIILIGTCVGLVMGLTGAGGGMLAVPLLVYSQGWTMQQSMPVALIAVSLGAFIGAIDGLRRKQVRYKAAVLMAIMGAPMTSLGIWLAQRLSQRILMAAFSLVLLIVVVRLVLQVIRTTSESANSHALVQLNRQTGRFDWTAKTACILGLIGSCAGFATGLLGVGGGFIIVPLLRHFSNLSIQSAAATSLMVIALVGSVAVGSAIFHGAQPPQFFSMIFAASSVASVLVGRKIANLLPSNTVQLIFAGLLFCVACSFLVKII